MQLNSLTGTYATSTYLAALKKSSKDLEKLAGDIEAFDKRIKDDAKVSAFIRAYRFSFYIKAVFLVRIRWALLDHQGWEPCSTEPEVDSTQRTPPFPLPTAKKLSPASSPTPPLPS